MNLQFNPMFCVVIVISIKCNEAENPKPILRDKMMNPHFAFSNFQGGPNTMSKNKTVKFNAENENEKTFTDHSMVSILFSHKIPHLAEITYSDLIERTIADVDDTIPDFIDHSLNVTEELITFRNTMAELRASAKKDIDILKLNLDGK